MLIRRPTIFLGVTLLITLVIVLACGTEDASREVGAPPGRHPILADLEEAALDAGGSVEGTMPADVIQQMTSMAKSAARSGPAAELIVDYPLDESVFPPEFLPPTFLWHDPEPRVDTWLIEIAFSDGSSKAITVLVPGAPPPKGEIDPEAIGKTNEVYEGTDYQNSATSWTPTRPLWERMKQRSLEASATLRFSGFASSDLEAPLSRGAVSIVTSRDPVGAPIFYRDVPLMPAVGERGRIKPLADSMLPLIAWRLRDVSRPETKLVLKGMSSCGNCHSFSLDGTTLGMDVDGPSGDKGMYAVKSVSRNMVIDSDDTITWNSFPDKPKDHKTIGFLSRMSPDGRYVVSTVNEETYIANFADYKFLQVFYPTRGILGYYSRSEGEMRALPGADDPKYVHSTPAWSPDGSELIFSRAIARDAYPEDAPRAKYPNDPNELPIQYDLYRMPFDGGRGGGAVPVPGASENGMSNSFPKVSPDGKWIVFVKCRNGQLMRPDSRLWIVPYEGGEAREMRCNTDRMNSWHSFSPNGRWMVFSSKTNTPYTQAFLTHIDEDGNDSPPILIPNCTAANRAVNLPEFLNAPYGALDSIDVPAVLHHVHFLEGERHLEAGEHEEAVASFEKALDLDPTFARAHVAMGYSLMQLERPDVAAKHFERATEYDPRNMLAHLNLGIRYLDTGRPDRAIDVLERALDIVPGEPRCRAQLERAREEMEQIDDEIERVREVLARDTQDPRAHRRLANLYEAAGRQKEAVASLSRAAELEPYEPHLLTRLAWKLATSPDDSIRDGARAVTLARRAVRLTEEKSPESFDALAAALAEVGRFDDAVSAAERALALAPIKAGVPAVGVEKRRDLYREGLPFRDDENR